MLSIPEKTEAARREEEERMEIERGVKLLDTSMEDTTDQDGKRSRVDSLSSHFVKICWLGSADVFELKDSTHPPPQHGATALRNNRTAPLLPHGQDRA